jgi:hypothetical protein
MLQSLLQCVTDPEAPTDAHEFSDRNPVDLAQGAWQKMESTPCLPWRQACGSNLVPLWPDEMPIPDPGSGVPPSQ